MEVRLARPSDGEAIRTLYNVEVATSTVTFDLVPRTAEEQAAWMEARSGALAVVVAEEAGEILGFASLSPYRNRPAYATTVEDSVYVARDARGRGVGSAVLGALLELAAVHGFHSVMARIADRNEASIELHRRHGFDVVGVEREVGRKFGRWLDVVLMQKML